MSIVEQFPSDGVFCVFVFFGGIVVCMHMLIPKWSQTPYGYGESPNAKFFISLPLSIQGLPYGNSETKMVTYSHMLIFS